MPSSSRKLILIVEDTPTNVAAITGLLRDSFRTKIATSGEKAVAIACEEEKPDLILLDVMMPDMDGFDTTNSMPMSAIGT